MNDEDIKKLRDALGTSDRDSFATFTSGLRSNWIFLIAIMGTAMWFFNNFTEQERVNLQQDAQIQTLVTSVAQLTTNVNSLATQFDSDNKNQSEIKQDIALIKADITSIKDDLKQQ